MSKKKAAFYVVWSGKNPGIYDNWDECEAQVKGTAGAKYKGFASRDEAEQAFRSSPEQYIVRKPKEAVGDQPSAISSPPILPALAVDAACSGNPGMMEYRGVDSATGRELFHFGPVAGGTNNIAEFLALVHVLALLQQQASSDPEHAEQLLTLPVYSDSRIAQAWLRKRCCATKLAETSDNAQLFAIIERAEKWVQTHTWRNPVIKWKTEVWGEIAADFGRK